MKNQQKANTPVRTSPFNLFIMHMISQFINRRVKIFVKRILCTLESIRTGTMMMPRTKSQQILSFKSITLGARILIGPCDGLTSIERQNCNLLFCYDGINIIYDHNRILMNIEVNIRYILKQ